MSETTSNTSPGPTPGDPRNQAPAGPPPTGQAPPPHGLDQLWDAMRRTGIRRPADDRWLGGVCAGVARRLGVDPVLIRVTAVALVLLGGVGLLAYALALVLLPDADGRVELERASWGDLTGTTVGAVGLVLLAIVVPGPWELLRGASLVQGGELVGALVVGTVLLIGLALLPKLREALERSAAARPPAPGRPGPTSGPMPTYGTPPTYATPPTYGQAPTYGTTPGYRPPSGSGSSSFQAAPTYGPPPTSPPPRAYGPPPAPRPPRPRRLGPGPGVSAAATGLALVSGGAGWLLAELDVLDGRPLVIAACFALTVLGLVIVGLGVAGRRDGGVGGTAFLVLVVTAAVLLVPSWRTTQLAGNAFWQPASEQRAVQGGTLGLGDGTLDLTELADLPAGADVQVPVRVGIGELEVLVPEGMDVSVRAAALVGSTVRADGFGDDEIGGIGVDRWLVRSDDPQVVVDARTLVGTVRLVEVDAP